MAKKSYRIRSTDNAVTVPGRTTFPKGTYVGTGDDNPPPPSSPTWLESIRQASLRQRGGRDYYPPYEETLYVAYLNQTAKLLGKEPTARIKQIPTWIENDSKTLKGLGQTATTYYQAAQLIPALASQALLGKSDYFQHVPVLDYLFNADQYPSGANLFSPLVWATDRSQRKAQEQAGTWGQNAFQQQQPQIDYGNIPYSPTPYNQSPQHPLYQATQPQTQPAQPSQGAAPFGVNSYGQRLDAGGNLWDPATATKDIYGRQFIQPGEKRWERNANGRLVKVEYQQGGGRRQIHGPKGKKNS